MPGTDGLGRPTCFEPIPTPGGFLTDAQLTASGRPARYAQPGTLPFVVQNAAYNAAGERLDYVCTTGDIGGAETQILPQGLHRFTVLSRFYGRVPSLPAVGRHLFQAVFS